jgi:hypothetical protein
MMAGGLYASGCRIAVFAQGLVSNDDNTQTTRVARTDLGEVALLEERRRK